MEPYGAVSPVHTATSLFDRRAAAIVRATVAIDGIGGSGPIRIFPSITSESGTRVKFRPPSILGVALGFPDFTVEVDTSSVPNAPWFLDRDLLELKWYDADAPTVFLARSKCLAAMAYLDYFPDQLATGQCLRALASAAILVASPGWCGTFGPGVASLVEAALRRPEGNYEFNQMSLAAVAYRYYGALSPAARGHLISELLAKGRIHRPGMGEEVTSGGMAFDWRLAGDSIPETENHILGILTARYLANQLLYQQTKDAEYDNRRNDDAGNPSCFALILTLLRNFLRNDFSEYNAKNYQEETRWALLNLCTYAYDHEVRLAARMVLDYVAAHFAVSSNDLRRMVPFRRRNEGKNVTTNWKGFMDVGLLEWEDGADPLVRYFAVQAGNVRAFAGWSVNRNWEWGIRGSGGDLAMEVLSDYRLPPSIHALFVNDDHRRFFQRLHRVDPHPFDRSEPMAEMHVDGDSSEIYASSPSYLITAGGQPATWSAPVTIVGFVRGDDQQRGVAVTTSFIPTGPLDQLEIPPFDSGLLHFGTRSDRATGVIQFGVFASEGPTRNYGVAPDFACGHQMWIPAWLNDLRESRSYLYVDELSGTVRERPEPPGFFFIDRGSRFIERAGRKTPRRADEPGFFLAIYEEDNGFGLLEALDTWLFPEVTFQDFKTSVLSTNGRIRLRNQALSTYITHKGNVVRFEISVDPEALVLGALAIPSYGAEVLDVVYGPGDPRDADGDAGNPRTGEAHFLNGTILNSRADGIVEIRNRLLATTITLDLSDPARPRRTIDSPDGLVVEVAGDNQEVWLDFEWAGPNSGDVCQPFNSLASASAAVADGGVIKIVPGATADRGPMGNGKTMTLEAPIGGVTIGGHGPTPGVGDESNGDQGAWVDFHWTGPRDEPPDGDVLRPFGNLATAIAAIDDEGIVTVVPGTTGERFALASGKRCTIVAPLGRVTIGLQGPGPLPPWVGGLKPL
jgi:hypothetical protein